LSGGAAPPPAPTAPKAGDVWTNPADGLKYVLLGMHLTQVAPAGSMDAEWKTTRERCKNSRLGSRPKKVVVGTFFNCGGRKDFGVRVAEGARRGQFVALCSSVRSATFKLQ
jgi:hypothetical protein